MLTLARNPDENSDTRRYALRRVAKTLPMPTSAALRHGGGTSAARVPDRSAGDAPESEATDKLIDIVEDRHGSAVCERGDLLP